MSAELRSALTNLNEKLNQQRDLIAQLHGSLKGERRLSLSQSIGNFSTGVTTFSLRCTRRWNQELQAICEDVQLSCFQKRAKVNALLEDFRRSSKESLQAFLDKYLSDDPNDSESISLATCDDASSGASLTIALSDEEKAFARDVKEEAMFFSQVLMLFPRRPPITIFPKAVARYRGRTALVSMELPALGTLESIHTLPEFKYVMELVCESLNLTSYYRTLDNGHEVLMQGPLDASTRLCIDGRYYIDRIGRLLPPFPPAPKTLLTDSHTLTLRREVVLSFGSQLSPAAFQVFGSRDSAEQARMVRHCAKLLCHDHIPKLVDQLTDDPPQSANGLIERIHDAGVNTGLLAIIYSHVPVSARDLRSLILTEMAARVARDHIRSLMLSKMDRLEVFECVSEFVAAVCNSESLPGTWADDIVRRMKSKFAGFATLLTPPPSYEQLNTRMWLPRVAELLKVTFAEGVTSDGSSPFHFSIVTIDPAVKTYQLPEFALCHMKYVEGDGLIPPPPAHHELTARPTTKFLVQRIGLLHNPVPGDNLNKYIASAKSFGTGFSYGRSLLDVASAMAAKKIPEASVYLASALEVLRALDDTITTGSALIEYGLAAVASSPFGDAVKRVVTGMNMIEQIQLHHATQVDKGKRIDEVDEEDFSGSIHSVFLTETATQLAAMYEQKGLFEEAEPLYRRVHESAVALFGSEDKHVSAALNDLAINLFQQQQYSEAEEFFVEDLRITEVLCGPNTPEVAASLNNLAALYDVSGRSEEAEPLYRRDLEITMLTLGEKHINVATSRNNLALCLKKLGRLEESSAEFGKALEIRQKYHGEKHVSVAEVLTNMGSLLVAEKKNEDARKTFQRALAIYDECVGVLHHSSKQCLDHLTELCQTMGLLDEAETYSDRLMDIKRAENEVYSAQQEAVSAGRAK